MKQILTKDGILLSILFIMAMSVIYFNYKDIAPSEAFMLLLGALVTAFIMKKEDIVDKGDTQVIDELIKELEE